MRLYRKHDRELHVSRKGLTVARTRARVGGGVYVREELTIAWPWARVSP